MGESLEEQIKQVPPGIYEAVKIVERVPDSAKYIKVGDSARGNLTFSGNGEFTRFTVWGENANGLSSSPIERLDLSNLLNGEFEIYTKNSTYLITRVLQA